MTQEDKELLLKDLCARLPYGVMMQYHEDYDWTPVELNCISKYTFNSTYSLEKCKPYLRSMSNMTDEEMEEWADLFNLELDKLNEIDDEDEAEEKAPLYFGNCHSVSIDWLNKNMFDYHGLIGKGLALEAPEGMYKF